MTCHLKILLLKSLTDWWSHCYFTYCYKKNCKEIFKNIAINKQYANRPICSNASEQNQFSLNYLVHPETTSHLNLPEANLAYKMCLFVCFKIGWAKRNQTNIMTNKPYLIKLRLHFWPRSKEKWIKENKLRAQPVCVLCFQDSIYQNADFSEVQPWFSESTGLYFL